MNKKISVATVAKRMGRILETYREQEKEDASTTLPEASTSSTFGQMVYSTERGLEVHKTILNFAAQNDESDSDSMDQSYEVPQTARRRQPSRAVKRPSTNVPMPTIKRKQRKPSTNAWTPNAIQTKIQSARASPTVHHTDIDGANVVNPIKASRSFNENDNRQTAK